MQIGADTAEYASRASFEIDLGTSGALGSRASDVKVREGMPDLGHLVEFGPRLSWRLGEGSSEGPGGDRWCVRLPLRGVFDLGNDLAFRGLILEPQIEFTRRGRTGWGATASVSAILGDERFNDLYDQSIRRLPRPRGRPTTRAPGW